MQNYEYRIVHLGLNLNCQGKSALRELSLNGWRIHKVVPILLEGSTKHFTVVLEKPVDYGWVAVELGIKGEDNTNWGSS